MVRQITTLIILTQVLFGWGKTGHRIVGEIAETYLTKNAKTQIKKLIIHQTKQLMLIATYMFKKLQTWYQIYLIQCKSLLLKQRMK